MADGRRLTFHFLLILLACGLVYANALENGFHLDDAYRVLNNPGAQNLLPWWQHFVDPGTSAQLPRLVHYRPLLPLSLSLNHALFGESLAAYHAVNLLLHAASALLAYLLSAELTRHWSGRDYPGWLPLTVALLFAVHPVGGVLVNYISGRDLLLMQLFATAALLVYLRLRRLGDTPLRWSCCLLLLLLALLAKTNAVVFPALVLAVEALFTRGSVPRYLRALPFAAVVAAFLLYIHVVLDFSDAANAIPRDASHLQYFLHQLQHHVFHYLRNFIWPWPMRLDAIDSISHWKIALGALALLTVVALLVRWWRREPLLAFCLLAYLIWMALESSVLPLHEEIAAYRPYPASVWLYLAVAVALARLGRAGPPLAMAAVLCLGLLSVQMNLIWRDDVSLWRHAIAHGAGARAHYSYAQGLADGDPAKLDAYRAALAIEPDFVIARVGYGLAAIRAGQSALGLEQFQHALKVEPAAAETYYWLSVARDLLDQHAPALAAAQQAMRLDPDNVEYRYQLGKLAIASGQHRQAVDVLEVLQSSAPDYKDVAYFLGGAHMSLGQHHEAIALFERALLKYPDYAPTHRLLAHCLQAVGDAVRANEHRAIAERLEAAAEKAAGRNAPGQAGKE